MCTVSCVQCRASVIVCHASRTDHGCGCVSTSPAKQSGPVPCGHSVCAFLCVGALQ